MPAAFPRPCPICRRELVVPPALRCRACQRDRDRRFGSSAARGYGHAWRKARTVYLQKHPFCVRCLSLGREVRAAELDHIRPHRGNADRFWDRTNWQPLCKRHHSQKTFAETKGRRPDRFRRGG